MLHKNDSFTKVVFEDNEREDINNNRDNLSKDHKRVPGAYFEGHHEQLGEDKGCEGDRHNVNELSLKQQEPNQHDHTTCKQCIHVLWECVVCGVCNVRVCGQNQVIGSV